jgi:hypothetical protein
MRYRDAGTGEFVTEEYALAHPGTTVSETEEGEMEAARQARLEALRAKRAASMHAGKPMTGYKERVAAIDAEIARLEAEGD